MTYRIDRNATRGVKKVVKLSKEQHVLFMFMTKLKTSRKNMVMSLLIIKINKGNTIGRTRGRYQIVKLVQTTIQPIINRPLLRQRMVRHIALIPPALPEGKESGKLVEGTTRVVYVCDKVEKPVEEYGNVVDY